MKYLPLPLLALANALVASAAPNGQQRQKPQDVVYTLSNDASGSNILALAVDHQTGQVSNPVLTSTHGNGQLGINGGPPAMPAAPDSLFSQGAVQVSGNYLFTVNAGSNTLAAFNIDPNDPLHPKLIGQPVDTMGQFPVSVTYSSQLRTACVLNGGAKSGVACFSVSQSGLRPAGSLRTLPQFQAQTPPTGPPKTASDIVFNPSSSAVFVTVKGMPGGNQTAATPGSVYAFRVGFDRQVSSTAVVSQPAKSVLDFGLSFLGGDDSAIIADPTYGASIFSISPQLQLRESAHVTVPNQKAICWSLFNQHRNVAYGIDAGQPNITVIDPRSGSIQGAIQFDASAKGAFDAALHRNFIYTTTGDNSMLVIDVAQRQGLGNQVQKFDLGGQGPVNGFMGLAAWPTRQAEQPWLDG